MHFNNNQKEYRLGLGLWFRIVANHPKNLTGLTSLSNIPDINYKALVSEDEETAVYEVMGTVGGGLELEYTEDTLKHLKK